MPTTNSKIYKIRRDYLSGADVNRDMVERGLYIYSSNENVHVMPSGGIKRLWDGFVHNVSMIIYE